MWPKQGNINKSPTGSIHQKCVYSYSMVNMRIKLESFGIFGCFWVMDNVWVRNMWSLNYWVLQVKKFKFMGAENLGDAWTNWSVLLYLLDATFIFVQQWIVFHQGQKFAKFSCFTHSKRDMVKGKCCQLRTCETNSWKKHLYDVRMSTQRQQHSQGPCDGVLKWRNFHVVMWQLTTEK